MPASRVTHFLVQTCEALAEAHQRGLVHRDIKPANIFAAQRGNRHDVTKLLDFGLAKPMSPVPDSVELTLEHSITGSPLYMSPEQALGDREPDARSDIYSLGAVAYFLLAGHPPFDFEKPMQVLLAHAKDRPAELLSIVPEIPPRLSEIVMRCLEKRPEDRFQSVEDLHQELTRCESYGTWTWDDARRWWREVDTEATAIPASYVKAS
jgi:serine/threonine-protein kinase